LPPFFFVARTVTDDPRTTAGALRAVDPSALVVPPLFVA
jgi:hypothetical protein